MAIGTTAAIIGGSVLGAAGSAYSAKKSAGAAKQAQDTVTAEQRRQFDLTRQDTAPQRQLGENAISLLSRMYGYGGNAPDMSGFFQSPDYQFNLAEGENAINRSAAARGGLLSGAAVKAGQRYASGLATREYSGFIDRLMQQAGLGSTGIGQSAAAGANAANAISGAAMNAGNARASAYASGAQGVNNAVQGGLSNMLLMQYLRPQAPAAPNLMAHNYTGTTTGAYA
jgi:hypothetical protein